MAEEEEETAILPLHSDFSPTAFRPYVLDVVGAGLATEGAPLALALVPLMRGGGYLLCLPELALDAEAVLGGQTAEPADFVGPSTKVEVQAATLDEDALLRQPSPVEGRALMVMLVDFSDAVAEHLTVLDSKDVLEELVTFDFAESTLVPLPQDVVSKALAWASGEGEQVADRIQFYSADEVPTTPSVAPKRQARRRVPGAGTGGGDSAASKRRPTVASLAESLAAITQALPEITSTLADLKDSTEAMEAGMQRPTDRASALRRPLSSSVLTGSHVPLQDPASLVRSMPPPKSSSAQPKTPRVTFSADEAAEMALDLPEGGCELTRAMVAQSQALTTLVSHLTANSSDPFQDLGSATASLSTKGAASRARLQAELAAQRGSFFVSVIQQMARRMQPAISPEVEMSTLRDRGITPTQYLERFGGFGRSRDVGFIIWQVGLVLNYMMEDNHNAAKDALSLLFVCLEQTAMDNGNMQVGLLLSLTEDPPQALFTNRSVATGALPRSFAPTAHQRWITTALQFLKEMDLIATRRAEVSAGKASNDKPHATGGSETAAPKKKLKGKGGGRSQKGQQNQATAEEEVQQ